MIREVIKMIDYKKAEQANEWWDNVKNLALYKIGWIYRSQAEAEAALPAVAAEMGVRYEL